MKKLKFFFGVFCVLFTSCNFYSKRDRIVFNDPIESVQDSIIVMNQLMDKIPANYVKNYYFDDEGYLYINSKKLLLKKSNIYDTKCIDTCKVFENFKPQEIKRFISIAIFLEGNFFDGHRDKAYDYRRLIDGEYDDSRSIVYLENGFDQLIPTENYKPFLLDSKLKLYLIKYK